MERMCDSLCGNLASAPYNRCSHCFHNKIFRCNRCHSCPAESGRSMCRQCFINTKNTHQRRTSVFPRQNKTDCVSRPLMNMNIHQNDSHNILDKKICICGKPCCRWTIFLFTLCRCHQFEFVL